MARDESSTSAVKSLNIAIDILEEVIFNDDDIGISQITSRLKLTKGSVFRYIKTLTDRGYISQNPQTLRYAPGLRLQMLGEMASRRVNLLSLSEPYMKFLRDQLSLTVHLGARTDDEVIVLQTFVSPSLVEINIRVGTRLPFALTSQGRVLLAFAKADLLATVKTQPLPSFTAHSVTELGEVMAMVAATKARGWAMAPEEVILGVNAVSAPIFQADGDCAAALTITGSIQFLTREPTPLQIQNLQDAAKAISTAMGYKGPYPGMP